MKRFLIVIGLMVAAAALSRADNPHGPTIVADTSFLSQTASIGTTTLFTPSADGNYEVLVYIRSHATIPTMVSTMDATLSWTDEVGALSASMVGAGANDGRLSNAGGNPNQTVFIRATSGNPIQFSSTYTSGAGSDAFDVYVVVVKE